MNGRISLVIADDHAVVRKGLRFILEQQPDLHVAGEAPDGRAAVALAQQLCPAAVILDIAMPELNGIEAGIEILRIRPETRIILLSMYSDEEYLIRALDAGVKVYLLKDSAEEDLVQAVRAALRGECFFSPAIARTLAEDYIRQLRARSLTDSYHLLTDREKEVLRLLGEGKANKEAATVLGLSPYTVETHRTRIMQKLNLHSTADIVLYAVRKKLVLW